jgi:hypothetical protein
MTKKQNKKMKKRKNKQTPGPKPDVLKIEGDWKAAIKKSLQKKKPAEGWPK